MTPHKYYVRFFWQKKILTYVRFRPIWAKSYLLNDVQFPLLKLKSFFITPAHKSFMYSLKLEILFISNDVMWKRYFWTWFFLNSCFFHSKASTCNIPKWLKKITAQLILKIVEFSWKCNIKKCTYALLSYKLQTTN